MFDNDLFLWHYLRSYVRNGITMYVCSIFHKNSDNSTPLNSGESLSKFVPYVGSALHVHTLRLNFSSNERWSISPIDAPFQHVHGEFKYASV